MLILSALLSIDLIIVMRFGSCPGLLFCDIRHRFLDFSLGLYLINFLLLIVSSSVHY